MTTPSRKRQQKLAAELLREQVAVLLSFREHHSLTQPALAELLGISVPSVQRYEAQRYPLSFSVAAKLANLAAERGPNHVARWSQNYLTHSLKSRVGLEAKLAAEWAIGRETEGQRVDALKEFLTIWPLFRPQVTPAEARIQERLNQLLAEIADAWMPKKQFRCPSCGHRARRFLIYQEGQPVEMYSCDRCKEGGRITERRKEDER